jgi:hypothetical protein
MAHQNLSYTSSDKGLFYVKGLVNREVNGLVRDIGWLAKPKLLKQVY